MTFVAKLSAEDMARLETELRSGNFEYKTIPYARFSARGEGVNCTLYESGKCVVQGKGLDQFVAHYFPGHELPSAEASAPSAATLEFDRIVVGSDESGKGDYFGPLVTAAVAFGPKDLPILEEARFADSKVMTHKAIRSCAAIIREKLPHEIVVVGPSKYNQLYAKFGNLNKLLAWCHGTALNGVLERVEADTIVVDKFCDEKVLRRGFKPLVQGKELILRTRAESNPAVAAASVLASDAFTRALERLGREVDLNLPKGAGRQVDLAGKRLVSVKGRDILEQVAKVHFRNTEKI